MAKTLTEMVYKSAEQINNFNNVMYDLLGDAYYEGMKSQERIDDNFYKEIMKEKTDEDYCSGWIDGWNNQAEINPVDVEYSYIYLWHDGNYYCGICGGSVDPVFNYCPTCGAIIELRDVL